MNGREDAILLNVHSEILARFNFETRPKDLNTTGVCSLMEGLKNGSYMKDRGS